MIGIPLVTQSRINQAHMDAPSATSIPLPWRLYALGRFSCGGVAVTLEADEDSCTLLAETLIDSATALLLAPFSFCLIVQPAFTEVELHVDTIALPFAPYPPGSECLG
jgi:hypothetical protein